MEEQYTIYDRVIATTLTNFMVEDIRNGGLVLPDFDMNNVDHLYSFEVALMLSQSIQKEFYIQMSLFSYWKFKLKNWTLRKQFKRYTNKIDIKPIELEAILSYMKKELSLEEDVYGKIYDEYYEKTIKYRSIYRWKRKK